MNNLCIFDLDGTLCHLKDLHFESLNRALAMYDRPIISREDHLTNMDGLPTEKKLFALGIVGNDAVKVSHYKQVFTLEGLSKHVKPDLAMVETFHKIIARGWLIGVCSNARQETVKEALRLLGVEFLVCWTFTPDCTTCRCKPSPEMMLRMMLAADACPRSTVIFEDSPTGLRAAHASGALTIQVDKPLTEKFVLNCLHTSIDYQYDWYDLNVIIPMAGDGKRFKDAGYVEPKPFIRMPDGQQMYKAVVSNLEAPMASFMYLMRGEHVNAHVDYEDAEYNDVVYVNSPTRGTAETCLLASQWIDNERSLLIANSDQLFEWDAMAFYYFARNTELDGVVVTFDCPERDVRWSYVSIDDKGLVECVVEKDPISDTACTGLWFWKRGGDFVRFAHRIVDNDIRFKGEYYVSTVLQAAIDAGLKFSTFKVDKFHGLGDPESLEKYIRSHS